MKHYINLYQAMTETEKDLIAWGQEVDTGHWQGVPTEGHPDLVTREMIGVAFSAPMPKKGPIRDLQELQEQIKPNLPWADDHFAERVSRVPSNPGEQYKNWPWWHGQEESTRDKYHLARFGFMFSHTYQERFWPKRAGAEEKDWNQGMAGSMHIHTPDLVGIRYPFGDLDDVVNLLEREPHTRQAYLPIFFPEDTGAVHGGRIPCSIGYHFLRRNDRLNIFYNIRSCDVVRHFRDDVYLTARLNLWVLNELKTHLDWMNVRPGMLYFNCSSLHVHKGDLHLLQERVKYAG